MTQQQQLTEQIAKLNQIIGEDGEQTLLEAISKQRWYGFKNKREIVFDTWTGLLFPNFEYMSYIPFNDWKNKQKDYAPNEIGKGEWKCLHDVFYYNRIDRELIFGNWKEDFRNDDLMKDFPSIFLGDKSVSFYYFKLRSKDRIVGLYYYRIFFDKINEKTQLVRQSEKDSEEENYNKKKIVPVLHILKNDDLAHNNPRYPIQEKSKFFLDFFIEKEWIPNFEPHIDTTLFQVEKTVKSSNWCDPTPTHTITETLLKNDIPENLADLQKQCDEYNRIFEAYYQRLQLQKQLAELPESEPNTFTPNFNHRQELEKYNLTEINNSVLQYSVSAQQWLNHLLAQIDHYENSHQHLLAHAAEINKNLTNKLPSSLKLEEKEQEILTTRHSFLQQHLNFSLESLKLALVEFLQQNKQTEITLKNPSSLTALAELEKQTRPSFTLLAEYSANLYNQAIQKLDWLEKSLDFVQTIIKSEQQSNLDYVVLLDKYQQDLIQTGLDHSIETEKVEKWFVEWREKRLQLLQQWQPLVEAGLTGVITEQTVLDTLQCLAQYQQQIDMFYLSERLGIYTTYAFAPNGHRQEEMAKELEFMNINHTFMKNLEKVIFATEITIEQKVWLVRFGEVWQQGTTQEIIKFLKNEGVFNRNDIAQIISEGERDIQQQNLAACLQDMKSYAQALGQREKTTNTLIYKMRKALEK